MKLKITICLFLFAGTASYSQSLRSAYNQAVEIILSNDSMLKDFCGQSEDYSLYKYYIKPSYGSFYTFLSNNDLDEKVIKRLKKYQKKMNKSSKKRTLILNTNIDNQGQDEYCIEIAFSEVKENILFAKVIGFQSNSDWTNRFHLSPIGYDVIFILNNGTIREHKLLKWRR